VPIKTVCATCIHGKEMRRGRGYPITKRRDKRVRGSIFLSAREAQDRRNHSMKVESLPETGNYSRGCKNSNPNRRISPKKSNRRTLATIGGVSLGMRLEAAGEGAGMVRWTVWSGRRRWTEVTQAPVALILSVFVSSMNSAPEASEPRRNTGTWMRMRDDRRDSEESTRGPSLDCSRRRTIVIVRKN
jgi:hypothetical protein